MPAALGLSWEERWSINDMNKGDLSFHPIMQPKGISARSKGLIYFISIWETNSAASSALKPTQSQALALEQQTD